RPRAVVTAGRPGASRAACLAAAEAAGPVVQADAGVRSHDTADAAERARRAADHGASFWIAATAQQTVNLVREGIALADVCTAGSLLAAALPRGDHRNGPRTVLVCTAGDATALWAALQPAAAAADASLARAAATD